MKTLLHLTFVMRVFFIGAFGFVLTIDHYHAQLAWAIPLLFIFVGPSFIVAAFDSTNPSN